MSPAADQRQSPVQGGQQPVALLGAHRQRRLDPDHPVAEQRRGDPDALDLQQVAGHRQREVAAVGQGADQALVPGHVEGVRQLETQEQPAAADVGDHPGVPAGQGLQTVAELGTAGPHAGQQPVGGEPVERGQPDPAGQRAAGERRGVPQGEGLGGQRGPAEHRTDRHQPATQRLGQGEDVGGHAVRGAPEQLAGAAQAGLHLVEDQDGAVLVAQRPQSRQVAGRGLADAALTLDRLHHHGGDAVLGRGHPVAHGAQVAVGHPVEAGGGGTEAGLVVRPAGGRQRAQGLAVEAHGGGQHQQPAGGRPGDLERGLDRLGAAVGEGHPVQPPGASSTSRAASSPAAAGTDGWTKEGSPVSRTAATAAQIAGSLCPKGSAP